MVPMYFSNPEVTDVNVPRLEERNPFRMEEDRPGELSRGGWTI